MDMESEIRKIIYFDRETIRNILQEQNKGKKETQTGVSASASSIAEIEASAKIGLAMPFFLRLSFLFTGRISAEFLIRRDKETTITSTEISDFDSLKPSLKEISQIQLKDIENSSTTFRVFGNYARMMQQGNTDDINIKGFNDVMNDFDGYDTYEIDNECYVRFNNTAFVSNYKRNELLSTKMTLYCIEVGIFKKKDFDFSQQLLQLQDMYSEVGTGATLADTHPPISWSKKNISAPTSTGSDSPASTKITLYDVVYACVPYEKQKDTVL